MRHAPHPNKAGFELNELLLHLPSVCCTCISNLLSLLTSGLLACAVLETAAERDTLQYSNMACRPVLDPAD
eukprot:6240192-Prymnesium_polylepis.1